ncbi:MAG: FkbM family methyltransferase, partial [Acidobacteriota bacterium]|nr:FkbM family methyltransferase [Acidobacteriota bacterium]
MSLRDIVKPLVKRPLNAVGLDIVRLAPPPPPPAPERAFRFAPTEADRYLWLTSRGINTVVDVGAHEGEFAAKIHAILPRASIFSFEPLADAFGRLASNMAGVPNFRAFNCACGDSDAKQIIYRNEFTPSSSLLHMARLHKDAFPFTEGETAEEVEVRRLDDVLPDPELRDNLLIKIDVQGYETRVVAGAQRLLSRADLLIVETSFRVLYEGQSLFDDLYDLLRPKGFRYAGNW